MARSLAARAFELRREDATYVLAHQDWAQLLIQNDDADSADEATLSYLEYLKSFDPSTLRAKNYLLLWATVLQKNRETLPRSIAYFSATFPSVDLDTPIPVRQIVAGRPAPGTGPKPR